MTSILKPGIAGLCLGTIVSVASAADWPQFRGPMRDGLSSETNLALDWSSNPPPELWRHPIGAGFSAISVVDGHLYTAYADATEETEEQEIAGKEFAVALDAATGEEVWRVDLGPKTFNEFGHGPRATPTIDGDLATYLSGSGHLLALDRDSGQQRWTVDLGEVFESRTPRFGFSGSALIEGNLVMLDVGGSGEGRSHVALNRANGDLVWSYGNNGRGGSAGYSSILPADFAGERQLIHIAGSEVRSVSLDGSKNWSFELPQGEAHSMPIFIPPNRVYASGATPVGAILVDIQKSEEGFEVEEVWRTNIMRNHFSSSVYLDGYLYGFDNASLKCLDMETGKQLWVKRGMGKGSLIAADGHLIVLSDLGKLVVAAATPDGFTEKGFLQALTGKSWTAPVLANGVLYVRNHTEIVAYDLRQGAGS